MTVTMHARLKSGQAWRASSFGNRSAKVERGQAGSRQVEAPDRQLQRTPVVKAAIFVEAACQAAIG